MRHPDGPRGRAGKGGPDAIPGLLTLGKEELMMND